MVIGVSITVLPFCRRNCTDDFVSLPGCAWLSTKACALPWLSHNSTQIAACSMSKADGLTGMSTKSATAIPGSISSILAGAVSNLASLLQDTNRLVEAEPLMRRALAIDEKSFGPEHPDVATRLNNLASLLQDTNRLVEAEPLYRRAFAIDEKSFGPEHPKVAVGLSNLASLLQSTNRLADAEPLIRRALAIDEKSFGPEHPIVAIGLNNLASLLQNTNRLVEAEPLMRRALAIDEKSFGPEHPRVAMRLSNLAELLRVTHRLGEAEPLIVARSLSTRRASGRNTPSLPSELNNLAVLSAEREDWAAAAALGRRAKLILIGRGDADSADRNGLGKAFLASNTSAFRAHARAIYRANAESNTAREEGFELAQWALQTSAAQALSQMAVRSAKGAGPLSQLVRERQDFVVRRAAEDKRLLAAVGRGDAAVSETARKSLASLESALDVLDARLSSEFKEYSELANPKPLTIAAAQAFLNDGEALVLFLDVPQFGNLPRDTLIWVVTKSDARWARIELAGRALAERVAALGCGLDRRWWEGEAKLLCHNLLAIDLEDVPDSGKPLPFDLSRARTLSGAVRPGRRLN